MSNANVIELERALADCIAYCRDHEDLEFVEYFQPRLEHARKKWESSSESSQREYLEWQAERIDEKVAWKRLARELKAAQTMLRKVNAIGYPDRSILYWDEEALTAEVDAMLGYLRERVDVIDGASSAADKLERLLTLATGENREEDEALHDYNRYVLFLAEALGTLNTAIADFRVSMRKNLGKEHADYRAIRWPLSVAPDELVL